LIISEVRESRKIEDWLFLSQLIIFIVEHLNLASLNEIHFFDTALVADDSLGWLINSAVKVDNKLIDKSSLTLFEEMVKTSFKLFELESLNY
jgi:hypothetical protein